MGHMTLVQFLNRPKTCSLLEHDVTSLFNNIFMPEAVDGQASTTDFEWHYDINSEHPIGDGNPGDDNCDPAHSPPHHLVPPVHPCLQVLKAKNKTQAPNAQASSSKHGRPEPAVKIAGKCSSKWKTPTSPVNF